jgi:hypothetical protein
MPHQRLVDELIDGSKDRASKFLEVELLRYHHNISEDFNYISEIKRAHEMGYPKSAELILANFRENLESEKYTKTYQ